MLGEAALQGAHQLRGVVVVELVEPAVVVGRVDEHLVDAAGLGGDVHRAEVVDDEPVVAVERGVQVGDDPHPPAARRRRRSRAPASVASSLPGQNGHGRSGSASICARPRREVGRTLGPLGHDRDPPPGEWVEAHLTHSAHPGYATVRGMAPAHRVTGRARSARVRSARTRSRGARCRRRTGGARSPPSASSSASPAAAAIASSSAGVGVADRPRPQADAARRR